MMFRAFAVAACLLIPAVPAQAQTIAAADPASIENALRVMGYLPKLETDKAGEPVIRSTLEGLKYSIYFYGCDTGKNCQHIQFSIAFETETPLTADLMNDWNSSRNVGQAFLDRNGDPVLEYYITTSGGLPVAAFDRIVSQWSRAALDFKTHIGWE